MSERDHDPSRTVTPALWDEAAEALPGMARIAATAPGCARPPGPWAPVCAPSRLLARALTDPRRGGRARPGGRP